MNNHKKFLENAKNAINQEFLQIALDRNAQRRRGAINDAFASIKDVDSLKLAGSRIREGIIADLPNKVEIFAANLENNGFIVHRANDGVEASKIVLDICQQNNAKLAAKSKSMVTEEIGLNEVLEDAGIETVETDLGEYIVQLREEKPTHIITPAVHLRREDVAETFVEKLGMEYSTDVRVMNDTARKALRNVFLEADVGISGVNFGIVDSGALCLLTNEGNGRMVTTVPPIHIAVMGMERLVNNWDDLAVLLQHLPRSATGQKVTSYVNIINGPRKSDDLDGSNQRHVVLVDNGRLNVQQSEFAEILKCIRCGACINVCPVYQEIGGATYGSVYPGPIGSVLSAALYGSEEFGHLSKASTLCGACGEICPVKIDLPGLLVKTRNQYIESVPQPFIIRAGIKMFGLIMKSSQRYEFVNRMASFIMRWLPSRNGWMKKIPFAFAGWSSSRYFPVFAKKTFHSKMMDEEVLQKVNSTPMITIKDSQKDIPLEDTNLPGKIEAFMEEVENLGGEVIRVEDHALPLALTKKIISEGINKVAITKGVDTKWPELEVILNKTGVGHMIIDDQADGVQSLKTDIQAGINIAHSGIADTGSLIFPGDSSNSQLISLLPETHIAIVSEEVIEFNLNHWVEKTPDDEIRSWSNLCFVSGPSRTADIEMTLTIGVHGPAKLIVFVI